MEKMVVIRWFAAVVLTAANESFRRETEGYDMESVSFSSFLSSGHEGEIVDGDTPFNDETVSWYASRGNCRGVYCETTNLPGELEGWETEDEENDGSFADAIGDLTDMFIGSPSDNVEVSIDLPTVVKHRNRGIDAYNAARQGWSRINSEYRDKGRYIYRKDRVVIWTSGGNCKSVYFKVVHKRDVPADAPNVDRWVKAFLTLAPSAPVNLGAEMSDDSDGLDVDYNDSEESWEDVSVRGAKGNGFYRYSRNLADDRYDRFLGMVRWIDSTKPSKVAVAFRSGGTFRKMMEENRFHNLYRGRCVYGPVYRAGSHESIRYTAEQVNVLTEVAHKRLGWNTRMSDKGFDHVVTYWRNVAKVAEVIHPVNPTPRECRLTPETTVTQERSYAGAAWPFTATESVDSGKWIVSTVRVNRRKPVDADKLLTPGKVREVNCKHRNPPVDEMGNRGHRLWTFCKR
jgi:hypothetical protein